MTTELDLAYIAGFVDGEGTIMLGKGRNKSGTPRFEVVLKIGNTDIAVLQYISSVFGGNVLRHRSEEADKTTNYKPCFIWRLGNLRACAVIKQLLPYLKVKKAQAKLVLEAQPILSARFGIGRPGGKRPLVPERVIEIYWELRKLNKRGRSPAPPQKTLEQLLKHVDVVTDSKRDSTEQAGTDAADTATKEVSNSSEDD